MPLPQQVIDRLSKEPPKTPGWSSGMLTFAGGVLFLTVIIYLGLAFGYGPYLDSQIANLNQQFTALGKTISPDDQAHIITFYSEVSNVQSVINNHVIFSRFFSWLETDTEANVYFSGMSFTSPSQVTLQAFAKSEDDVNQQMAIFENDPEVKTVTISGVSISPANGLFQFSISLAMQTSALRLPPASSATSTNMHSTTTSQ